MSPMIFTSSVFAGTTIFVFAERAFSTVMSFLSTSRRPRLCSADSENFFDPEIVRPDQHVFRTASCRWTDE